MSSRSGWGVTLAAMLGQTGLPGGGVGFGYSAINAVGNHTGHLPGTALPQGRNEVADFIPVVRISDLLLNPGGEFDYNGRRYTYPDTRMVWWAGGNPFHHHQDLNRMLRAWSRPETIIVNDAWWNPMARHTDIVLPGRCRSFVRHSPTPTSIAGLRVARRTCRAPYHGFPVGPRPSRSSELGIRKVLGFSSSSGDIWPTGGSPSTGTSPKFRSGSRSHSK